MKKKQQKRKKKVMSKKPISTKKNRKASSEIVGMNLRLPKATYDALERHKRERHQSKHGAILKALEDYLEKHGYIKVDRASTEGSFGADC